MSEEDTIEVEVTEAFTFGGKTLEPGETTKLPTSAANSAVNKGYAKKAGDEIPAIDESGEQEETGRVNVEDYMKSGGWLTAEEVEEGDVLTIKGNAHFDDRFEQKYLVVSVVHDGSEYNLRVGKRNTRRISKEFGTDATKWTGKKVEVAAIQQYEGVNAKGMILRPVTD